MTPAHIRRLLSRFERLRKATETEVYMDEDEWETLLEYLYENDELEQAQQAIDLATARYAYAPDLWLLRAKIYLELQNTTEALAALQTVQLYRKTENIELHTLFADAYMQQRDYAAALQHLHTAIGFAKEDAELGEIYLSIANIYEEQNNYTKAFDALRLAALHLSDNDEVWGRLHTATQLSGRYADSVEVHTRLTDAYPFSCLAWYNLAEAHAALGANEAAIIAYEYAMVNDEGFTRAYRGLAKIYTAEYLYEKAIETLYKAIEENPIDADLLVDLGDNYKALAQTEMAKQYYHQAIKAEPQAHVAYFRLGEIFMDTQQWQSAITMLDAAVTRQSNRADYWAALAEAYTRTANDVAAENAYRQALRLTPEDADTWLLYANFLMQAERPKEAIDVIEEAESFAQSLLFAYAKTAALFLAHKRQAALQTLAFALQEHYDGHHYLLDILPHLVKDSAVVALLIR